jgi:hypothetical protein
VSGAQVAGVDCELTPFRGDDPIAYVVSLNLKRDGDEQGEDVSV